MIMSQTISFHYDVPGDDFTRAGEASSSIKKALKQVGLAPDIILNAGPLISENHMNRIRRDIHINFSSAGVDDHIDLPLVQGDGHLAHHRAGQPQFFKHALHAAAGLAGPGKIVPRYIVFQPDRLVTHPLRSPLSAPPRRAGRRR